jgi:hypothetical protein
MLAIEQQVMAGGKLEAAAVRAEADAGRRIA